MSAGRKNTNTKKDWNTPPKYILPITEFFEGKIELDPCSNNSSLVIAKNNLFEHDDGLSKEWNFKSVFVNSPYGRAGGRSIFDWIRKGIDEHEKYKCELIYLIPVATNTRHFKNLIFKYFSSICFLEDTRLKFYENGIENKKGAPMGCCLVYLGFDKIKFNKHFSEYGKCFSI